MANTPDIGSVLFPALPELNWERRIGKNAAGLVDTARLARQWYVAVGWFPKTMSLYPPQLDGAPSERRLLYLCLARRYTRVFEWHRVVGTQQNWGYWLQVARPDLVVDYIFGGHPE